MTLSMVVAAGAAFNFFVDTIAGRKLKKSL
jgi:hypothetical protein